MNLDAWLVMLALEVDVDTPISVVYDKVYGDGAYNPNDHRICQQRLGMYVHRFNKRMAKEGRDLRIKPGDLKRTYRLTREA